MIFWFHDGFNRFQFQTVRLQAEGANITLTTTGSFNSKRYDYRARSLLPVKSPLRFQFQTVRLQAVACKLRTSLLFGFNSKRYDYRVCVRAFSPLRQKVSIPNGTITGRSINMCILLIFNNLRWLKSQ